MKVLVDSCIWSLALRRNSTAPLNADEQHLKSQLQALIEDGRVAMIGPVRQELLSGLRDIAQFDRLRQFLKPFPDEPLVTADYEEAARIFNICSSQGVSGGPIDMLICAVALRRKWALLTCDNRLQECIELARGSTETKHP